MKRHLIITITIIAALLATSPCFAFYNAEPGATPQRGEWGYKLHGIPLTWSPTKSVTEFDPIDTTIFRNIKIVVRPFADSRKNTAEIGRNTEEKELRLVTTKDNVPAWFTDRFIKTLNEFNVDTVKSDGTVILDAIILKFYVTETSTYKADVALNVKMTTKDRKTLWEGMIVGSARNFGSSYKEQNYHEAISHAVLDLVYNFLKNEPIKQALKIYR